MKRTEVLIAIAVAAAAVWFLTTGCGSAASPTVSSPSLTTTTSLVSTEQTMATSHTKTTVEKTGMRRTSQFCVYELGCWMVFER